MNAKPTLKFTYRPEPINGVYEIAEGKFIEHTIVENVVQIGEAPDGFPKFIVQLSRQTGLADQSGRPIMDQQAIVLKAFTVEEAFAILPEVIEAWTNQSKKNVNAALLNVKGPMGFDPKKPVQNGFHPRITG